MTWQKEKNSKELKQKKKKEKLAVGIGNRVLVRVFRVEEKVL